MTNIRAMLLVCFALLAIAVLVGCANTITNDPVSDLVEAVDDLVVYQEPEAEDPPSAPPQVSRAEVKAKVCEALKLYGFPLQAKTGDTVATQRQIVTANSAYICSCYSAQDRPYGMVCAKA